MGDIVKQKKSRTISIGSCKTYVNDIGNKQLHDRHKVGIVKYQNSNIGRAIVYDQHLIDILFLEKHLDERQHSVCDKYLGLISKGMHLNSNSFDERSSTGKYYLSPIPRSCVLIGVQRHLKQSCGKKLESHFWKLMVQSPTKLKSVEIKVMKKCAEALTSYYYVSYDSPVSLFEEALLNQA
tara:strand:- start:419 stop:961 length:543 start_codon:yes stop_codon:yes gene_type:complete